MAVGREVSKRTEIRRAAAKYPADVAADVTSGPSYWRWCRRHVDRSFSWQISGRCLTCSQTNRGKRKQRQRVLSHYGSPFTAVPNSGRDSCFVIFVAL